MFQRGFRQNTTFGLSLRAVCGARNALPSLPLGAFRPRHPLFARFIRHRRHPLFARFIRHRRRSQTRPNEHRSLVSPPQRKRKLFHNENEKGHPLGCPFLFWLREKDSELWFCAKRCCCPALSQRKTLKMLPHFLSPSSSTHSNKKNKAHRSVCLAFLWLREEDSNFRPLGYEPNELPLLHPAICGCASSALT